MPVSVNQPNRREERDPMDAILKGLQIAGSIYGIKEGSEKAKHLAEQKTREAETAKFNQNVKEAELTAQGFQKQEDGTWKRPEGWRDLDREKKEAEIEALKRRGSGDPLAEEMKLQRLSEMKRKAEEAAALKTPEGRLKSLNSGDKQRLDNAKLGLISVQGMADALLRKDQNTFSLIGDNDFTQQRTLFEEALGRMQSGGAITAEEADRFKKMAPTWRDSAEMQQTKLLQLQQEMQSRLGTLGFSPDQLGVQVTDIGSLKSGSALRPPGMENSINAAPVPRGSPAPRGTPSPSEGFSNTQNAAAQLLMKRKGMSGKLPK